MHKIMPSIGESLALPLGLSTDSTVGDLQSTLSAALSLGLTGFDRNNQQLVGDDGLKVRFAKRFQLGGLHLDKPASGEMPRTRTWLNFHHPSNGDYSVDAQVIYAQMYPGRKDEASYSLGGTLAGFRNLAEFVMFQDGLALIASRA